jgi:subtilisin
MPTPPKRRPAARPRRPRRHKVTRRAHRYLIAPRPADRLPAHVSPLEFGALEKHIIEHSAYDYKRTLRPEGVSSLSADDPGAQPVVVARMGREHVEMLRQTRAVIVEPDAPVDYAYPGPPEVPVRDPGLLMAGDSVDLSVTILGPAGEPVAGATVYLEGRMWPYQAVSGPDGRAVITLRGEPGNGLKSLYVNPAADYWSIYVDRPALMVEGENVVTLQLLGAMLPGFPDTETIGWGEHAMRIPELPPTHRGAGTKVAVIDSGATIVHPDLDHIVRGYDVAAKNDTGWDDDQIGHGSHCAGVIAGRENGRGIVGIAPDAEVHVYKIFPGGRFSDVLDALDQCMNAGIDVANMSLGSPQRSEILEARLELAKSMGVACVVATGNNGGPVQHPAASPHVLAVSAIGKLGEYPPDSYHARRVPEDGRTTEEGYFSASFSCYGPEVGVCGPGVAVVSSVPDVRYTAMDGTSMAAPHVTGLAALLLAHHPDFKGRYKTRGAERVERLFEILKQSAQPLDFGDPGRSGAGLPDAVRAFETDAADGSSAPETPAATALQQLAELLRAVGLDPGGASGEVATGQAPTAAVARPVTDGVERLRGLLDAAGLGGEAVPRSSPLGRGAAEPSVQTLDDLKAAMENFSG